MAVYAMLTVKLHPGGCVIQNKATESLLKTSCVFTRGKAEDTGRTAEHYFTFQHESGLLGIHHPSVQEVAR